MLDICCRRRLENWVKTTWWSIWWMHATGTLSCLVHTLRQQQVTWALSFWKFSRCVDLLGDSEPLQQCIKVTCHRIYWTGSAPLFVAIMVTYDLNKKVHKCEEQWHKLTWNSRCKWSWAILPNVLIPLNYTLDSALNCYAPLSASADKSPVPCITRLRCRTVCIMRAVSLWACCSIRSSFILVQNVIKLHLRSVLFFIIHSLFHLKWHHLNSLLLSWDISQTN
jgi:hypothetical protein